MESLQTSPSVRKVGEDWPSKRAFIEHRQKHHVKLQVATVSLMLRSLIIIMRKIKIK